MNCYNCKNYNKEKNKCKKHGEIINILCCKDYEKEKADKKKITFLFCKNGIMYYKIEGKNAKSRRYNTSKQPRNEKARTRTATPLAYASCPKGH